MTAELKLGRREFSICFVNDREIRHYNTVYRKKRLPTDVLAFQWSEDDDGFPSNKKLPRGSWPKDYLGDILISAQAAKRQARENGHTPQKEIYFLVVHGLLHLLGMDHEVDHGEMIRREMILCETLGLCEHKKKGKIDKTNNIK